MMRGFCTVTASFGLGVGHAGLLMRLTPEVGADSSLRQWLLQDVLLNLPSNPGLGSVQLLEGTQTPPMTNEQLIRGADAGVDRVLFVSGYREVALADLAQAALDSTRLGRYGASGVVAATYRLDYSLTNREIDA